MNRFKYEILYIDENNNRHSLNTFDADKFESKEIAEETLNIVCEQFNKAMPKLLFFWIDYELC